MNKKRRYGKFFGKRLELFRILEEVALFTVFFIIVFSFIIGVTKVDGSSMSPTLFDGQSVLFFRLEKNYSSGDLIAVRMPDNEFIVKRVVAVEGDTIDIHDGSVYVNGNVVYSYLGYTDEKEFNSYPLKVGVGQVFILGDNRDVSVDSRDFGPISLTQTKGKLIIY